MIMSRFPHDVFAADIYCHKPCSPKFAFNSSAQKEEYNDATQSKEIDSVNEFLGNIRVQYLRIAGHHKYKRRTRYRLIPLNKQCPQRENC